MIQHVRVVRPFGLGLGLAWAIVIGCLQATGNAATLAGYWDSSVTAAEGGRVTLLLAFAPAESTAIFAGGYPTGLFIHDDGLDGDERAGDGLATFQADVPPDALPLHVLLTIPDAGNWPYLTIEAGSTTTPSPTPVPTSAPSSTPTPLPTVAQYDFSRVTTRLQADLGQYDGNVVMVVMRGGDVLYHFQAGNSQVTGAFDLNTIVGIASATKWPSGATVLSVAESGAIGLDDRIGDWIADFDTFGKGDWTLQQGFSMASGMYFDDSATENPLTPEINPFMTHAFSVRRIAQTCPLHFPAGQGLAYDGAGMQAVGQACVLATGAASWQALAEQRILGPLGMTHTTYDRFGLNPAVAGGIRTNARDYLRLLRMVADGGVFEGQRILSAASVDLMFSDAVTDGQPVYTSPWPNGPFYPYGERSPQYNFGCWTQAKNPGTNRVEEICSPGANGTWPWVDRKRDVYGIIFTFVPSLGQVMVSELAILDLTRRILDGDVPTPTPGVPLTPTPAPQPTFTPTPTP